MSSPRVINTCGAAEVTDVGHAGVEADARDELFAADFHRAHFAKFQCGIARAHGVIGLRFGCVPEGEDGIANVFHDRAIGGMNAGADRPLEILVHHLGQFIGVHAFGNGSEAGNVAEKNREFHFLSAGLEDTAVLVTRELLHELRREIHGHGLLEELVLQLRLHPVVEHCPAQGGRDLDRHHREPGKPEMQMP